MDIQIMEMWGITLRPSSSTTGVFENTQLQLGFLIGCKKIPLKKLKLEFLYPIKTPD